MIVKLSPKISSSTPAADIDFKGTHSLDKEQRCDYLLCSPWDIKKKLLKVVRTNLRFAVPEKGDWVIPAKENERVKKGAEAANCGTGDGGFEICCWIGVPQVCSFLSDPDSSCSSVSTKPALSTDKGHCRYCTAPWEFAALAVAWSGAAYGQILFMELEFFSVFVAAKRLLNLSRNYLRGCKANFGIPRLTQLQNWYSQHSCPDTACTFPSFWNHHYAGLVQLSFPGNSIHPSWNFIKVKNEEKTPKQRAGKW